MSVGIPVSMPIHISIGMPIGMSICVPIGVPIGVSITGGHCSFDGGYLERKLLRRESGRVEG